MLIKVKFDCRELEFDVAPSLKVYELKPILSERIGCEPEQLRLLFEGRPMRDDRNLESHHVVDDSLLHVVRAFFAG